MLLSNALFPTLNLERPFKEGPDVNDSPTFRVNRTQHVSVTKPFEPKEEAEGTQPNASGGVEALSEFSPCYYENRLLRELLTRPLLALCVLRLEKVVSACSVRACLLPMGNFGVGLG